MDKKDWNFIYFIGIGLIVFIVVKRKYLDQDSVIKNTQTSSEKIKYQNLEYKYHENGRVKILTERDDDNRILKQRFYDKNGILLEEISFDRKGKIEKQEKFDKDGFKYLTKKFVNEKLTDKITYEIIRRTGSNSYNIKWYHEKYKNGIYTGYGRYHNSITTSESSSMYVEPYELDVIKKLNKNHE